MRVNGTDEQVEDDDKIELTDDEANDEEPTGVERYAEAVVFSTDWTAGTVVQQLERENIRLSPRFQRRDAWDKARKSRLIESLILGLPVPPVVLAEERRSKGKYLVLDGKQRLLSLLQFWGLGEGEKNAFALTGLEFRADLRGKTYQDLSDDPTLSDTRAALENQTIRTIVIRNWPDNEFLHKVFLRLNTGSMKLSPQELRQALLPGPFSDFVDDKASDSKGLRRLLKLKEPDSRMRDVEILARFIAFANFADTYRGRMKTFLDEQFEILNREWPKRQATVEKQVENFEHALQALFKIFGADKVARKQRSRQLNRTLLDAQLYYLAQEPIRKAAVKHADDVAKAHADMLQNDHEFVAALERDTAGLPSTTIRFDRLAKTLSASTGITVKPPTFVGSTAG